MAVTYNLSPAGFSFEVSNGYYKIPIEIIGDYYTHARGTSADLYIVRRFSRESSMDICHGVIRNKDYTLTPDMKKALQPKQYALSFYLDKHLAAAKREIVRSTDFYQVHEGDFSAVYARAKGGDYIGCGWWDHAGTMKKGLKMAAFVLYAFGFINAPNDEELWETTYKYLPYGSELGRSDIADAIIKYRIEGDDIHQTERTFTIVNDGKK